MAHKGARLQSLAWDFLLHAVKEKKQGQDQEQEQEQEQEQDLKLDKEQEREKEQDPAKKLHPVLSVVNRQPEVVTREEPGQVVFIHKISITFVSRAG